MTRRIPKLITWSLLASLLMVAAPHSAGSSWGAPKDKAADHKPKDKSKGGGNQGAVQGSDGGQGSGQSSNVQAANSQAPIAWTYSLGQAGGWLHSLPIGPTGELAVQTCVAGKVLSVLSREGTEIWSLPSQGSECPYETTPGIFDDAGNFYAVAHADPPRVRSFSPTGTMRWEAILDGRLWSTEWGVILGADSNVYVAEQSANEFGNPSVFLRGFRSSDGLPVLDKEVGGFGDSGDLSASADGLYVGTWGKSHYYSYAGEPVGEPHQDGGFIQWFIASPGENGTAFRMARDDESCTVRRTVPSGPAWSVPIPTDCWQFNPQIIATPDGGVSVVTMSGAPGDLALTVTSFSGAGSLRWTSTLQPPHGWWVYTGSNPAAADVNGNLAFVATYEDYCYTDPIAGTVGTCRGASVIVVDTSGNVVYQEAIEAPSPQGVVTSSALMVDADRVYVGLQYVDHRAQTGLGNQVAALSVPGIGRSFLDKVLHPYREETPEEPIQYVALGDSYSSGTGVPPYDAGTHTSSNQCHRSAGAYPRLFAVSEGLEPLHLACHGARLPQLADQLAEAAPTGDSVSLMSLTIGGNDVGFADVIFSCLFEPRCERGPRAKSVDRDIRELGRLLTDLYADIAEVAPNAEVFVMGYPDFFPPKPRGRTVLNLDKHELTWLRSVGAQLNSVIAKAVDKRVKSGDLKFHYVNVFQTFDGHEACGPNEWVHCIVSDDSHDFLDSFHESFHPNALGHGVLARCLHEAVEAAEAKFKCDAPA